MKPRLAGLVGLAALAATTSTRAETVRIKVDKLSFEPAEVTVRVGDEIEWFNADFVAHTATARDKSWDVMLSPKKSGTFTATGTGEIGYFCRFHPNMVGRITVLSK